MGKVTRSSSSNSGSSSQSNGFPGWLHEVASSYPSLAAALDAPSSTHEMQHLHYSQRQLSSSSSARMKGSPSEARTSSVMVAPPRGDGSGLPVFRSSPTSSSSSASGMKWGENGAQTSPLRYYYVAACLYNSAPLLQNGWADQVVKLATHLRGRGLPERPDAAGATPEGESTEDGSDTSIWNRVFVSIYENDSKDSTPAELKKLKERLDKLGVRTRARYRYQIAHMLAFCSHGCSAQLLFVRNSSSVRFFMFLFMTGGKLHRARAPGQRQPRAGPH